MVMEKCTISTLKSVIEEKSGRNSGGDALEIERLMPLRRGHAKNSVSGIKKLVQRDHSSAFALSEEATFAS